MAIDSWKFSRCFISFEQYVRGPWRVVRRLERASFLTIPIFIGPAMGLWTTGNLRRKPRGRTTTFHLPRYLWILGLLTAGRRTFFATIQLAYRCWCMAT